MARIDIAGKDNKQETIVTYRKEQDGSYTKIVKHILRDHKTGLTSSTKLRPEEFGPYTLVPEGNDFDEKTSFQDINGEEKFLYFKMTESSTKDIEEI